MRYVVGLSGGKDSTALALRLKDVEPRTDWEYIITPTGDELPEMLAHWTYLESLLKKPLIRITNQGHTLNSLIQIQKGLPSFRLRWCTRLLKIQPTIAWCVKNAPVTLHVGLRADEEVRAGIYGDYVASRFPFREWNWSLKDVLEYLELREISIPKRTDCARCFFQRLSEWHSLYLNYPDIYWEAAQQEITYGHTFRRPNQDTWPASLIDLAAAFQSGRPLRNSTKKDMCRVCSL